MLKHWTGPLLVAAVVACGFEIRSYYTEPGRMDALRARFRDHTNKLFKKQGMTTIG